MPAELTRHVQAIADEGGYSFEDCLVALLGRALDASDFPTPTAPRSTGPLTEASEEQATVLTEEELHRALIRRIEARVWLLTKVGKSTVAPKEAPLLYRSLKEDYPSHFRGLTAEDVYSALMKWTPSKPKKGEHSTNGVVAFLLVKGRPAHFPEKDSRKRLKENIRQASLRGVQRPRNSKRGD